MDQNTKPPRRIPVTATLAILIAVGVAVHAGAFLMLAPMMR